MEIDQEKITRNLKKLSHANIFDELYAHLQWSRKYSGYARQETLQQRFHELQCEISEVQKALSLGDNKNLAEELGDALWDLLFLFVLLEEKSIANPKQVIRERLDKQVRRIPHVYEGKIVSKEEEMAAWKESKRKEKEENKKNLTT